MMYGLVNVTVNSSRQGRPRQQHSSPLSVRTAARHLPDRRSVVIIIIVVVVVLRRRPSPDRLRRRKPRGCVALPTESPPRRLRGAANTAD